MGFDPNWLLARTTIFPPPPRAKVKMEPLSMQRTTETFYSVRSLWSKDRLLPGDWFDIGSRIGIFYGLLHAAAEKLNKDN